MSHVRLFIPGPIEVDPDVLKAMATPMIGHRMADFAELYAGIRPKLQQLFKTSRPTLVSTSSATGVMEASVRNLAKENVLALVCGAFSQRWAEIAENCGRNVTRLEVEWGNAIDPVAVDDALAGGTFDLVTLVHNETSTGVMNPLADIAAVVRKHDNVLLATDTVSSFSGVPTPFDELGIDVCLAGCQKALAMPPGITVFAVSERAEARASEVEGRGFYFDFLQFLKYDKKDNTPSTPSISHFYALDKALDQILAEGLEARYARHRSLQAMCHAWIKLNGFELLPDAGNASVTLSTIRNTRGVNVVDLNKRLRANRGLVISNGYGKLKEETFRISHMGNTSESELAEVLEAVTAELG